MTHSNLGKLFHVQEESSVLLIPVLLSVHTCLTTMKRPGLLISDKRSDGMIAPLNAIGRAARWSRWMPSSSAMDYTCVYSNRCCDVLG